MTKDVGLRFNSGKTRYDLVPQSMVEGVAKVLGYGAEKYTVKNEKGEVIVRGDNNWKRGLSWMDVKASHDRHIAAWLSGEDVDSESGQLHIDLALTNLAFLKEYYQIYPQGDDRPHKYLNAPRIGLDIDCVLADWISAYKAVYKYPNDHQFDSWYLNYKILERCTNDLGDDFYLNLKPLVDPKTLKFEPHCYITARHSSRAKVTEEWLYRNGFPCVPIHMIEPGGSKVELAKQAKVDIFVDDVYKNFLELNEAGVCCYLLDAPHNVKFNVGYKRIKSLNELPCI